MKHRGIYCALAAEAAACILFCLMQVWFTGIFSAAAAFPFEQIGWGLRRLSLSGAAGNAAAIILYILISLLPCAAYYILRRTKKDCKTDWFLAVLSLLLFLVNYFMINPGLLSGNTAGSGKWLLGCTFYSVLCGYLILRVLSVYRRASASKLQGGLKILLYLVMFMFVYVIFGQCFGKLLASIQELYAGKSLSEAEAVLIGRMPGLTLTCLFLVLQLGVEALPYLMDFAAVYFALHALDTLMEDRYSGEAMAAVKRLADFCPTALAVTVVVEVTFNVLQWAMQNQLYKINITIHFPVLSMIFVLAMMLAARYLQEDQKLKQEHDLFI